MVGRRERKARAKPQPRWTLEQEFQRRLLKRILECERRSDRGGCNDESSGVDIAGPSGFYQCRAHRRHGKKKRQINRQRVLTRIAQRIEDLAACKQCRAGNDGKPTGKAERKPKQWLAGKAGMDCACIGDCPDSDGNARQ
jgi:hypothetical protein